VDRTARGQSTTRKLMTRARKIRACLQLVLLFSGLASLSACGSVVQDDATSEVRGVDQIDATDPGAEAAIALDAIVSRLGSEAIVETSVLGAPADYVPVEDPSIPIPAEFSEGKWIYFLVKAPEDGPGANRAIWEANLAVGALRDSLAASGGPPLYNVVISLQLPGGEVIPNAAGGLGVPEAEQNEASASAAETEATIRAGAANVGLTLKSLDILAPQRLAPALVLEAPKDWDLSRTALEPDTLIRDILGDPTFYDGFYIEIDDASGELISVNHVAYRAGVGTRWVRADLDPRTSAPAEP
jgi:hypothetical protein